MECKRSSENRNRPWSDLPQELLSTISNTLTSNPLWILAFRSICNLWRSSCPRLSRTSLLSPLLPLSVPSPPSYFHHSVDFYSNFILSVTVIYALRRPLELSDDLFSTLASNSWILFLDEFNAGKVCIRKPSPRGSYSMPINFTNTINLIDFNVCELGRFHSFSFSSNYDHLGNLLNKPRYSSTKFEKVVLFSNGLAAIVLLNDGKLGMVTLDVGINESGKSGISKWKNIHDSKGFFFDDIVEYEGNVLGINRRGKVYEIVYHSFEIHFVVPSIVGGGGRRKRLVESSRSLYLVVRCKADNDIMTDSSTIMTLHEFNVCGHMTTFKVYKLDEGRNKWSQIGSLGDRFFFFGLDSSFSAAAFELGTCRTNCILFKPQSFRSYNGRDESI